MLSDHLAVTFQYFLHNISIPTLCQDLWPHSPHSAHRQLIYICFISLFILKPYNSNILLSSLPEYVLQESSHS